MPTPQRRQPVGVIQRLLDEPHRFQFFQALRLLERWHARSARTPRREVLARHVHFRNSLALTFPPSEIESLRVLPRSDETTALPDVEMVPAFFGLLGVAGALPHFYTELLARRELYDKDTAARAFLDVFQQRATSLLYEAWRKHRLPLQYEDDRRKHFLPHVLALAGVGQPALRERLAASHRPGADEPVAYFAATFQQRNRPAVQMQRVLSAHLGVPVRIDQFVGRWHALPESAQTKLGFTGGVLGHTALAGERVWQRDLRVRVALGPMSRRRFQEFLPGEPGSKSLRAMLELMCGVTLEVEVQLRLQPTEAQPIAFGPRAEPVRLGWDTWLHSRPPQRVLEDTRYDLIAA
jgi:type VI secretion system protein ImpH